MGNARGRFLQMCGFAKGLVLQTDKFCNAFFFYGLELHREGSVITEPTMSDNTELTVNKINFFGKVLDKFHTSAVICIFSTFWEQWNSNSLEEGNAFGIRYFALHIV